MRNLIFGGHFVFLEAICLKGGLRVVKIYLHAQSRACKIERGMLIFRCRILCMLAPQQVELCVCLSVCLS